MRGEDATNLIWAYCRAQDFQLSQISPEKDIIWAE